MILRIGEASPAGQLRIDELKGDTREVTFLASGARDRLPKKVPVEIPTWFVEMQLDLPGEDPFIVERGESFRLDREPGRVLRLIEVEESGAKVIDSQSGNIMTIGAMSESSD